jgi:hypothetical protein
MWSGIDVRRVCFRVGGIEPRPVVDQTDRTGGQMRRGEPDACVTCRNLWQWRGNVSYATGDKLDLPAPPPSSWSGVSEHLSGNALE